jgi:hypothetical protein
MFRIGYPIIYLPRLKLRGHEDFKKLLVENSCFVMSLFDVIDFEFRSCWLLLHID